VENDQTHQLLEFLIQKKMNETIVDGHSVNNDDMHWIVNCPTCERELEYTGYFDSDDINKCKCGTEFKTRRIYFDNNSYIE